MAQGHRQRLKKQFIATNFRGMEDHVVLELLLSYCIPRRETNTLAHELLNKFSNLSNVLKAPVHELTSIDGIGQSTAVFLSLIFETTQRLIMGSYKDSKGRLRLDTTESAAAYAINLFLRDHREVLRLISLGKDGYVINSSIVAMGDIEAIAVSPRSLIEQALKDGAHHVIIAHNHPGTNPLPSQGDTTAFNRLSESFSSLGLSLLDSLIISTDAVYSTREHCVYFYPGLGISKTVSANELLCPREPRV